MTEQPSYEQLEEMLRSIAGESWVLVGADGMVTYGVGPRGGILGHGAREGTHIADYVHPDDLTKALDGIARVFDEPDVPVTEVARCLRGDGSYGLYEVTAVNRLGDERLGAVVVRTRELRDDGAVVPEGVTSLVESLAEVVPTPIVVTDHVGYVLYRNAPAASLLGPHRAHVGDLVVRPPDGEVRVSTVPLGDRWVQVRTQASAVGCVAMLDDVTDARRAEERLRDLATIDPLTGVANRLLLDQRLAASVASGDVVSVVYVDLDGFKAVNDRHGHAAGDEVLRTVAARLRDEVRPGDLVARLGGDEFAVVCDGLDASGARRLSVRLLDAVRAPIAVGDVQLSVGASVGTATAPPSSADAAALLAEADRAMYRAKR